MIKIKAIFDEMLNRINNEDNETYDYKEIINDLMEYIEKNKVTEVR